MTSLFSQGRKYPYKLLHMCVSHSSPYPLQVGLSSLTSCTVSML